jgi:hypothetical protein
MGVLRMIKVRKASLELKSWVLIVLLIILFSLLTFGIIKLMGLFG